VVRAIALHHGAQWRLEPLSPGLRVRLLFPHPGTWTNRHLPESAPPDAAAQSGFTGHAPVIPSQTLRSFP
jgi:hypothetical protein